MLHVSFIKKNEYGGGGGYSAFNLLIATIFGFDLCVTRDMEGVSYLIISNGFQIVSI